MEYLQLTADELINALMGLACSEPVCLLDSSGVSHLGSHLLIAGIGPVAIHEFPDEDPDAVISALNSYLSGGHAAIFTLSYDLGRKLHKIESRRDPGPEPGAFISLFDALIIHDYAEGTTRLIGNPAKFAGIRTRLAANHEKNERSPMARTVVTSNFTRSEYTHAIEAIKERIRQGDTYQTNLTHRLTAHLGPGSTPEVIFQRLRRLHPSPFAAYLRRPGSTVISASPERFFRLDGRRIQTSPIKGTRPRGADETSDEQQRAELISSQKDRAENTMIVDLLRNDLGRVCEYGSVNVEKLCELEQHPSLFHLVSTISGTLQPGIQLSDVIKALFPCGSITGAPKISTMRIINEIERSDRGLSMGAIGYYIPPEIFGMSEVFDTSVAIRTMVIRDGVAEFNVGGGIVIDSDPNAEYDETLTKASALLSAINGTLE